MLNQGMSYFFLLIQMSQTKLSIRTETILRQLFFHQLFRFFVLFLNGTIAPNSSVSHEFVDDMAELSSGSENAANSNKIIVGIHELLKNVKS